MIEVDRLRCLIGQHNETWHLEIRGIGESVSKRLIGKCLVCHKQTYDSGWIQTKEDELQGEIRWPDDFYH